MAEMLQASRYQSWEACRCKQCRSNDRRGADSCRRRIARAHEKVSWRREAAEDLRQDREAEIDAQHEATYQEKVHSHWAWQLLSS